MNTFISLWEEETNETFEQVIEKSKLVLSLIEKLKLILLETPSCDLNNRTILQHQGSILRLQELLSLKVDVATELLLRQASTLADLDSGNMEKTIQDENITLYVWANLKKNPRYRSVKFADTEIGFEIPRILATSDIAIRLLHTRYDHVTPLYTTDLPEEKEPTPVVSEHFKTAESTERDNNTEEKVSVEEKAASQDDQAESRQQGELSIVREEIKFEVPGDIDIKRVRCTEDVETTKYKLEMKLLSEAVSAGKLWRTDGISNIVYNRETRLITFSLDTVGPVALIQDAHINMPYQSWELRPLDANKVLMTVTTLFLELQIHIKENLCMLASIKLEDQDRLSHLEGKWMTPAPFILALKEAGLNIFPTVYSHFYVVINNKMPLVEMKAYRQMALLSAAFSFRWSKWNMVCNSTRVVFWVKEDLAAAAKDHLLMFSGERAQVLKMREDSDVFSETLEEETEFHSTLYHMVKDFASPEAMTKVRHSNCQFIDSVCHMLLSVRVLSYS
ncbi:dynein axonemal intermediate chain 7 isoform X3 [Acomys russatus]|uniref:dynein axonemal intermediate chain 7 isoform X3 n=1 Tax=Acomys russatus TaxID=60746 RepID=UPI0021E207A6|nr:dynein axonemal intermediate chain 7 isoform X3 [Acomys russatus]